MIVAHRTAAAVAVAVVAAGCASEPVGEAVSAANLQKNITERLTTAGVTPKVVTCSSGLPAEPGASTRCDVVLTDTNSIQPVVTLTTTDPVNYAVTPAVSGQQLATAVGALLSTDEVSCAAGLEGKTGAQAICEVTRDGVAMTRIVEVTNVEGLLMSYSVLPAIDRDEAQDLLAMQWAEDNGGRLPERTDCRGDLQGQVGATLDCTVVVDGQSSDLTLTVTKVDGDAVEFGYEPKG